MKAHVEQTISDAVAMIAKLQDVIHVLRGWNGDTQTEPILEANPEMSQAENRATDAMRARRNAKQKRVKSEGRKLGSGRYRSRDKFIPVVKGLKEPFDPMMAQSATEENYKNTYNLLRFWVKRGWLRKVGFGQYQRTAEFGKSASEDAEALRREIHAEIDAAKPQED